jgi:hypothetical protein
MSKRHGRRFNAFMDKDTRSRSLGAFDPLRRVLANDLTWNIARALGVLR